MEMYRRTVVVARVARGSGTGATGAVGITARGLRHGYGTADGPLTVLDGVDLDVAPGEFIAVTGASGAGKTTLLSLLGGLEPLQHGTVIVGDDDLRGLSRDALAAYRRGTVGFVFQDYGLLEVLTAHENVELALAVAGTRRSVRRRRADALLDAVGLRARRSHRPAALSGGERQRVAIARALANEPRLVLADEPTGNLDDTAAQRVLDLLRSLPKEHGCTVITVTHNVRVADAADRELRLASGRLVGIEASSPSGREAGDREVQRDARASRSWREGMEAE